MTKNTYGLPQSLLDAVQKVIRVDEAKDESKDYRGAYKPGTKVHVDGNAGEVTSVRHSSTHPKYPHLYKISDASNKEKRMENGGYIPHHRIIIHRQKTIDEAKDEKKKLSDKKIVLTGKEMIDLNPKMENYDYPIATVISPIKTPSKKKHLDSLISRYNDLVVQKKKCMKDGNIRSATDINQQLQYVHDEIHNNHGHAEVAIKIKEEQMNEYTEDELKRSRERMEADKKRMIQYRKDNPRFDALVKRGEESIARRKAVTTPKYLTKEESCPICNGEGCKCKKSIEQVDEVLTKSDPAVKWVDDFVKSDNPKFEGKSKAKRIQMALGAYYAKKKDK